jgi:hypothetical protein
MDDTTVKEPIVAEFNHETQDEPVEIGGRTKGLNPTRYTDWEKDGRAIDF